MPLLDFPPAREMVDDLGPRNIQSDLVGGLGATNPSPRALSNSRFRPSRSRAGCTGPAMDRNQSNHSEAREAMKSFVCLGGSIKSALSRSF